MVLTEKELQILDQAIQQGMQYRIVKSKGKWNGYNVYNGYYEEVGEVMFSGSPRYILEKDGQCRISTYDESFEIFDHFSGNDKRT